VESAADDARIGTIATILAAVAFVGFAPDGVAKDKVSNLSTRVAGDDLALLRFPDVTLKVDDLF
jgi:hypothetical protein